MREHRPGIWVTRNGGIWTRTRVGWGGMVWIGLEGVRLDMDVDQADTSFCFTYLLAFAFALLAST